MNGVASLAMATSAFVGTHLLMSHPLRPALVARVGERGFAAFYSLIAFATLGWMILAWPSAEGSQPNWIAPLWWWRIASALMLIACILLVGSLFRNPAFPKPGAKPKAIGEPAGVFAITRHPMNTSFMLWALVHLSLWGSTRNLIVAGGIFLLALVGSIGQDRKKAGLLGEPWREWQARTSFLPFGAILDGRIRWSAAWPGAIATIGGLVLWLAVTWYHAPMVSPIGWLGRGF